MPSVLHWLVAAIGCLWGTAAIAQPLNRSAAWSREYEASRVDWELLVSRNPAIAGSEVFFRGLVAEIRAAGRSGSTYGPFGTNFKQLLDDQITVQCFDLSLCKAKLTPAFRLADPPGATDIIQYLVEATCYGFVPGATRQSDAMRRLESVVASIDKARLIASLTTADRLYLKRDFADLVTTVDNDPASGRQRGLFPHLRELVRLSYPPEPKITGWPGRIRPPDKAVIEAAQRACN